jgi:hypothetical protein
LPLVFPPNLSQACREIFAARCQLADEERNTFIWNQLQVFLEAWPRKVFHNDEMIFGSRIHAAIEDLDHIGMGLPT